MKTAKPKKGPRTTTSTRWTKGELSILELAASLHGVRRSDIVRRASLSLAKHIIETHGEEE